MPKQFLEDMVRDKRKREGRPEQDLPVEKPRRETTALKPKAKKLVQEEYAEIKTKYVEPTKPRSRYGLWIVAFISILFCFFAVSYLFSKAEVTIDPKIQDVVVKESLSAKKDRAGDGLVFDVIIIPGSVSTTIQATGEKDVKNPATGTVILYNNFSAASQKLAIDTRLEGSNGKMYKTQAATVIPGKKADGTPGSVEVKIYAVDVGPSYNSGPLDFKIFGFKGTPKYTKFYGRSKGSLSGGFVGKAPAVSDEDKNAAISGLKDSLKTKLLAQAAGQIPPGFVLFKDAAILSADDSNITYTTDEKAGSVTYKNSGNLYGILLSGEELTQKIADDSIDLSDNAPLYIPHISNLKFTLTNQDDASFADMKSIEFTLSGKAQIVWKLDTDKFVSDLLDRPKRDFNQILSQYPNVSSATLSLSPLWKMSIPDKAENIHVTVNYPK